MSTGWQINRKRSEAIYESDSCPDRDVLASDLGLFKCTLNANCGNILFVQCSFNDTALFGGGAGRALRLGIEATEAVRRPVSRVLSPAFRGADGWPFIWDARCRTPRATYPDGGAETRLTGLVLRPGRPAVPTWSCSRWGLPCRPRRRGRGALLPHPFTLACLRPLRGFGGRFAFCGTFPRVAPAGRYPAPCSRGARTFLSRRRTRARAPRAAIRPSDHLDSYVVEGPSSTRATRARRRPALSASTSPVSAAGRKWRWKAATTAGKSCSR